mmetsp:Transcript_74442/g.205432  ORF Transcript_74442/g.205432 Transcript_74442/m.205432 type:complete len:208 (-) Transcript_74442:803-1426(-)
MDRGRRLHDAVRFDAGSMDLLQRVGGSRIEETRHLQGLRAGPHEQPSSKGKDIRNHKLGRDVLGEAVAHVRMLQDKLHGAPYTGSNLQGRGPAHPRVVPTGGVAHRHVQAAPKWLLPLLVREQHRTDHVVAFVLQLERSRAHQFLLHHGAVVPARPLEKTARWRWGLVHKHRGHVATKPTLNRECLIVLGREADDWPRGHPAEQRGC